MLSYGDPSCQCWCPEQQLILIKIYSMNLLLARCTLKSVPINEIALRKSLAQTDRSGDFYLESRCSDFIQDDDHQCNRHMDYEMEGFHLGEMVVCLLVLNSGLKLWFNRDSINLLFLFYGFVQQWLLSSSMILGVL